MVRAGCLDAGFRDTLLELVHSAWKKQRVPQDWANAVVVSIPKKDDQTRCNNWCGVALLNVVGKVMARVVQGRLQQLAEDILPESQCDFRKGCGCTYMIFTVQLCTLARSLCGVLWLHPGRVYSPISRGIRTT